MYDRRAREVIMEAKVAVRRIIGAIRSRLLHGKLYDIDTSWSSRLVSVYGERVEWGRKRREEGATCVVLKPGATALPCLFISSFASQATALAWSLGQRTSDHTFILAPFHHLLFAPHSAHLRRPN